MEAFLPAGGGLTAAACDALGVACLSPPGASGRPAVGVTFQTSPAPCADGRRATDGA